MTRNTAFLIFVGMAGISGTLSGGRPPEARSTMTPDSLPRADAPQSGASSRRTLLIVAGLGLIAVLAVVGLLAGGSGDEASRAEAARATPGAGPKQGGSHPGGAGGPSGKSAAGAEAEAAPRRFEATPCWK